MAAHTDVVRYRWTELDWAAARAGLSVTPYKIPASSLEGARDYALGQTIEVSLGLTTDPPTVARFFRDGYEWVPLPDGVVALTLVDLFGALFAKDPVRFAHFDPLLVMATAAAHDFDLVKKASPLDLLDPALQPFADLAWLHFEYWGNGEWRGQVVDDIVRPVTTVEPAATWPWGKLPWEWPHPHTAAMIALAPQAIPIDKAGAKLAKVLARSAIRGAPIKAIARASGMPATMHVTSLPPPRIELDGWNRQTFVPFKLGEWKLRESKIRFRVTLPLPATRTHFEILHARNVIHSEAHDGGQFVLPGVHIWSWDGYDDDGVLDTALLAKNELSARVTIVDAKGRTSVATTELGSGFDSIRWVEARIDTKSKSVHVAVHARFSNPSDVELTTFHIPLPTLPGGASVGGSVQAAAAAGGALMPLASASGAIPEIPGVPMAELISGDQLAIPLRIPSVFDLHPSRFEQFKSDIVAGIAYHWSRSISLDGEPWAISVSCKERAKDSVRTFLADALSSGMSKLGIDGVTLPGDMGERSTNLATFAEGLPIIDVWTPNDEFRQHTGAHELGHSVLRETNNFYYSLTHKRTSTVMQVSLPSAPAFPPEQESGRYEGEFDLMLYTNPPNTAPPDWTYKHTFATEDDARGLVWMSKVVFG